MRPVFLSLCGTLLALTASAPAATITYTESAIGSGTIDGTAFSDTLVTFIAIGNTANVTHNSGTVYFSTVATTITVAGRRTDSLTDTIGIVCNQGLAVAGLSDVTTDYVIQVTSNPVFGTYDLTTGIGPVSGANIANSGRAFATSGGSFTLDSISGNSTFQATIPSTATTPEPSSLLLLASGSVGLAGAARRRLSR